MPLSERISRLSPRSALCWAALLMGAVYAADVLTGIEISTSIFYLLPISLVNWRLGLRWATAASLAATVLWLHADIAGGHVYSHPSIPVWNAGVRLAFFLVISFLLDRIRTADRMKSDLIALVSHEFGNLLTPMKLAFGLLPQPVEPSLKHSHKVIGNCLQRLRVTVATFLNMTRLSSGRFRLERRPTPVRELVHEALEPMLPLLESRLQRLETDYPPDVVPVDCDPDALLLVLSNLVVNAAKYTPAGGRIVVRVRVVDGPVRSVLISVEDSGIGISPEEKRRIVEGYFRAERGKAVAKGTGIGLYVSRDILESHGARLEIDSEPGKGSRFSFRLPVWRGAALPAGT